MKTPSLARRFARSALMVLALVFAGSPAFAHPLAPSSLILREVSGPPGSLRMTWRTPRQRPRGEQFAPVLPANCVIEPQGEREVLAADVLVSTARVRCGGGPLAGLGGRRLAVRGLAHTESNVFVELVLLDGRKWNALLHARASSVRFEPTSTNDLVAFIALGVRHLLGGADHVLFVLGIVLLVGRVRDLVWLVSAFTVGHSISLALSATGIVRLPSAPVEMLIAASLLWLALRVLARREQLTTPAPSPRRAVAVCACFGLLHGLGFASAFADAGASGDALPRALFGFNVGVELGQLALVVPAALLARWLRRSDIEQRREARWMAIGAYVIGTASAYFLIVRAPMVLAAFR